MVTVIVQHEVSDYDKWLAAMNSDNPGTAPEGLQERKLYRTPEGSGVVVVDTFDTLENAEKLRAFLENPENRPMGESLGVVFPITFWIVEEI